MDAEWCLHMSYDIIGDIRGQAGKLEALLARLGYCESGGAWCHPGRTGSSWATSSTVGRTSLGKSTLLQVALDWLLRRSSDGRLLADFAHIASP